MSAASYNHGMGRKVLCVVLLALGIGPATVWLLGGTHVPANRRALVEGLQANQRIEGIEVVSHEKGFGWPLDENYHIDGATFNLKGRPDAIVDLAAPGPDIFTAPRYVSLGRVGPYILYQSSIVSNSCISGAVNIAPNADGPLPPFRVASLDDVIDHYDDLIAYFATQPREQTFVDRDGRQWTRTVERQKRQAGKAG
jgi:hypothetical protein